MVNIWDYDINELKKTEKGRIFILERMINYGPGKEKIKLSLVKKYWDKLYFRNVIPAFTLSLSKGRRGSRLINTKRFFWI